MVAPTAGDKVLTLYVLRFAPLLDADSFHRRRHGGTFFPDCGRHPGA